MSLIPSIEVCYINNMAEKKICLLKPDSEISMHFGELVTKHSDRKMN